MQAREFVAYAKKYAIDDTVASMTRELRSPQDFPKQEIKSDVQRAIAEWVSTQQRRRQEQSDWFLGLDEDAQKRVTSLLKECSETTLQSFFSLIDGVGGEYEGTFEIVAVDRNEGRSVVNPENADMMLHDLLSEASAEGPEN